MKRKTVAALLAVSVFASLLGGGCAGSGTKKSKKSVDEEKLLTVGDDGKVDGLMNAKGIPLVDKEGEYSFSIFCDDSSATGEFYMMDVLKKQTNVDVKLNIFPYETATERLNLDLNSGDYSDVIGGWTLSDASVLTYGVNQGVLLPLEKYYEAYCPNISAMLELPGVREKMTAPDGHIYTIPYVTKDTTVGYSPYINGRWLQNVGMSMPKTTKEFENVLRAFKEKDANGNGNPSDEIPFSTDPNNKHIEAMTGWFGLPMNKVGMTVKDGANAYAGVSSTYREFLKWFNKLYKEGLIDTELYTQDSATWEGKGNKDLYGVSIAYESKEFSGIVQKPEKSEFDFLPVLNVDKGGTWLRDTNGFSVYRTQAAITDKAEHPEIICRWFDNAFELENGIGCNRGPVGLVTFKDGDGYKAIDSNTLDAQTQEKVAWQNLWPQSLPKYLPADFTFKEDNPLYDEKKAVETAYEPYLTKDIISTGWIAANDIDKYSDLAAALQDYFEQQQAMFVSGQLDINDDAAWNAYVDGMKSLGLDEYLKILGVKTIIE